MKRFENEKWKIVLTCLLSLSPLFIGLILWRQLPERIPTHFNYLGKADQYSSKAFAVFVMPSFLLFLHLLCLYVTGKDPNNKNLSDKIMRAEKWGIDTPGATATTGGVLLCYDTTEFIKTIKEAKSNSDYVIAIIHWGTEESHRLEQVQKTTALDYLNAGADIIVGGHAHTLQGIDYNGGRPIVYNLGDFIFNDETEDTGILQIKFLAEGGVKFYFLPGQQKNVFTDLLAGDARARKINEILSWDGSNAKILADGEIVAK